MEAAPVTPSYPHAHTSPSLNVTTHPPHHKIIVTSSTRLLRNINFFTNYGNVNTFSFKLISTLVSQFWWIYLSWLQWYRRYIDMCASVCVSVNVLTANAWVTTPPLLSNHSGWLTSNGSDTWHKISFFLFWHILHTISNILMSVWVTVWQTVLPSYPTT